MRFTRLPTAQELPGETPDESAAPESAGQPESVELRQQVIEALSSIYDPEIPVNIYELGLIYDIDIDDSRFVNLKMTLTSPACPVAGTLPPEVENKVGMVPGASGSKVEIVWDPPWDMSKMSEAARLQLNLM